MRYSACLIDLVVLRVLSMPFEVVRNRIHWSHDLHIPASCGILFKLYLRQTFRVYGIIACGSLNTKASREITPFHQKLSDTQPLLPTSDTQHSQVYKHPLHSDLCIAILDSVKCWHPEPDTDEREYSSQRSHHRASSLK